MKNEGEMRKWKLQVGLHLSCLLAAPQLENTLALFGGPSHLESPVSLNRMEKTLFLASFAPRAQACDLGSSNQIQPHETSKSLPSLLCSQGTGM